MRELTEFTSLARPHGETGVSPEVVFRRTDLDPVPERIEGTGLELNKRERFASYGLVDNCILTVSREVSSALGAWMVTCLLQRNSRTYEVTMGTWRLRLDLRDRHQLMALGIDEWIWAPRPDLDKRLAELPAEADRPRVVVCNDDDFYRSIDEWNQRDMVSVSGSATAMLSLGGFFLDFGHPSCTLNYEYIKAVGTSAPDLATPSSCEFRVELAGARNP